MLDVYTILRRHATSSTLRVTYTDGTVATVKRDTDGKACVVSVEEVSAVLSAADTVSFRGKKVQGSQGQAKGSGKVEGTIAASLWNGIDPDAEEEAKTSKPRKGRKGLGNETSEAHTEETVPTNGQTA